MSIILHNECVLYSLDESDFKFSTFRNSEQGFFSFTINVKPIKPFDKGDIYQEYNRLRSKLFYEAKKLSLYGQDFTISIISIPNHHQYLSVWLQSKEPMNYKEAKNIAIKLLSLAEFSRNPHEPFIAWQTLDDYRPWYKRIFDWFL